MPHHFTHCLPTIICVMLMSIVFFLLCATFLCDCILACLCTYFLFHFYFCVIPCDCYNFVLSPSLVFPCNFRKSCMQRLRVAYDFRCRALYNLPWRVSISSHQVQCDIPTFEALLWKNTSISWKCRKSSNIWLCALMRSDYLCSSLVFEHCNYILLCEWVLDHCSVCLIDGVSCHIAFAFYLALTSLGIGALLCSSVVTSATCLLTIVLRMYM